jgi:hypothetical protein
MEDKRDIIKRVIKQSTLDLYKIIEKECWNNISTNTLYFISEIKHPVDGDIVEYRKNDLKKNQKKKPLSLNKVVEHFKEFYDDCYDINLHVFKSRKNVTIIDVKYFLKTSLDSSAYFDVKDRAPMVHAKFILPPYRANDYEKHDVNWQLGGFTHFWRKYLMNMKFKK